MQRTLQINTKSATSHLESFFTLWYSQENPVQENKVWFSSSHKQTVYFCVEKMPNIFINESKFQNKYKTIKRVYVEGENTILTEEWIL